jgi:hypothetical protein
MDGDGHRTHCCAGAFRASCHPGRCGWNERDLAGDPVPEPARAGPPSEVRSADVVLDLDETPPATRQPRTRARDARASLATLVSASQMTK